MIRHFCDGCGAELPKRYVRVRVLPECWTDDADGVKLELCATCYGRMRAAVPKLPLGYAPKEAADREEDDPR